MLQTKKVGFYQVIFNNYKTIIESCFDNSLKHTLVDQIGQFNKTIVDSFYAGNYKNLTLISSFYYCFIYILYINNICVENTIKLVNKNMFKFISSFFVKINNSNIKVNMLNSNKRKIIVNEVNYVGFTSIKNNNNEIDIML